MRTPGAAVLSAPGRWRASVRRILPLAWPVYVGQLSVLAFGTLDTLLLARFAVTDLAALALGSSAYMMVFIGLLSTVMAISPIAGRCWGAGQAREAGRQFWQALWLGAALVPVGVPLLLWPDPLLAATGAAPELAAKLRGYLLLLAGALPAALAFAAFRGFNTGVSRPRRTMVLQLGALALKVPLALLLVPGWPDWGVPALGVLGCGLSTLLVWWLQAAAALLWLRRDAFYRRFALWDAGQWRPHRASLLAMLRLGAPMGAGIAVEVAGFAAMALFIARLGEAAVAGHQIAANLVALLFMLPLALSHATAALVAQRIGAADLADARRLGWHGLGLAVLLALLAGGALWLARPQVVALYTTQPAVAAAALPLLAWVLAYHVVDAVQALTSFVLRAWRVATAPMLIYLFAVWGVGIAGGQWLAFGSDSPAAADASALVLALTPPPDWRGARGFWIASAAGLALAAAALTGLLWAVMRVQAPATPARR